jgi:Domain of unknown function (DUF4399)
MKRRFLVLTAMSVGAAAVLAGCANPNMAPPGGGNGVYFIAPLDGATVSSPFTVKFGLVGMGIKPAGELAAGTGHHHLLINDTAMPAGQVIPANDTHIHFGKGQTETEVKLAPGTYKLTLQFADGYHQSYGSEMSATITVTVK